MEKMNIDYFAFKCTESHRFVLMVHKRNVRDGEVDDRRVLLHKEVVLGESFNAENEVWRKFGQLKPFKEILLVGFVLLQQSKILWYFVFLRQQNI